MLPGSGGESQEQGELGEMVEGAERLRGEQRAKAMQRGIKQATDSVKPVPPVPVAGESQVTRTDTFFTFMKLHGKDRREKKPNE